MRNSRPQAYESGKRSSSHHLGRCLGLLGLVIGTVWCLKKHGSSRPTRHRSSNLPSHPAESRNSHLLITVLGAAVTGLVAITAVLRPDRMARSEVTLKGSITINRPPEEVYQFWRRFENLPEVMSFLEHAEPQERNLYYWRARGPVGPALEWYSKITEDDPGKLLAWRAVEGSDLQTWGTVTFEPVEGHERTILSVNFTFCPPANATGAMLKFLSGLESSVLDKNLRNLKAKLETGEIPTGRRYNSAIPNPVNGGQS